MLMFLGRCKALETTERYSASLSSGRNTVAAHSWRVAMMVLIISSEYNLSLNVERAVMLALTHDLAEAVTGDLDAYEQIIGGASVVEDKAIKERSAMKQLTKDLSFGGVMFSYWREYEDQQTIEAKFVKALDRIEGFLHIAEQGLEAYIPADFHSSYANDAVRAFDEASHAHPGLMPLLEVVKNQIKTACEARGIKWIE